MANVNHIVLYRLFLSCYLENCKSRLLVCTIIFQISNFSDFYIFYVTMLFICMSFVFINFKFADRLLQSKLLLWWEYFSKPSPSIETILFVMSWGSGVAMLPRKWRCTRLDPAWREYVEVAVAGKAFVVCCCYYTHKCCWVKCNLQRLDCSLSVLQLMIKLSCVCKWGL